MTFDRMANEDFERAYLKAFWRKVANWLTKGENELLPYDEVRNHLPIRGQHYIGLQQVPIAQIVGSLGRYRDFDRAFLPLQKRTKDRWVSIDKAQYEEVDLPPIELYKIGEVYFVKDGNHRVSVARERGQEFVDARVVEIEVPVPLTTDTKLSDLDMKQEYAQFVETTGLFSIRPQARIDLTLPGEYDCVLEQINVHRWHLGQQKQTDIPISDAVASWYDNVYTPLVNSIEDLGLAEEFPDRTVSDLYLWVFEYLWYLREAIRDEFDLEQATKQFVSQYSTWPVKRLVDLLEKAAWIEYFILSQERTEFLSRTNIQQLRPDADIHITIPGMYEKLLEHIDVHRWYLGEQKKSEVSYEEAVLSWYDQVYLPLVKIIREQHILREFPGRTEADLYLWIIEHQGMLRSTYGDEIPLETAAENFAEDYSQHITDKGAVARKKKAKKES
jgi:uncharacterized membrane protein YfbV (UPF0208 family)